MSRGRDKFNKAKGIINHIVRFYSIFPAKLRTRWFVRHRNTNGNIGIVIRYALLKTLAKSIGDNVSIQPGAYIFNPKELEIGDNVSIHPMCYIEAWGGCKIGNDVSIAHGVSIISFSHSWSDFDVAIKDQPTIKQPICIENNVWIGARAVILGGVKVEEGSIVGAGAVLTKSTEKNGIYAGTPARPIKKRE